jgi:hypothetical protein
MMESRGLFLKMLALAWVLLCGGHQLAQACTVFVLTDGHNTLFCNNEDWSNPQARIWFVPSAAGRGCAYVGFDDNWAQGGINSDGLAFDWVAGSSTKWEPDPGAIAVRGNPAQRMLETCSNVAEAVQFFRTHQEQEFASAKILVADRSGASAVIGAKNGQLQVELMNRNRGFGYGAEALVKLLASSPSPTMAKGSQILRACLQSGQYATKYSNIYDLKSGDIFLFPNPDQAIPVKLNLAAELNKGGHYYDMRDIPRQQTQAIKHLRKDMALDLLDRYQAIVDGEPLVRERVQGLLRDAIAGTMKAADFSPELWAALEPQQAELKRQGEAFGALLAPPKLVDRESDGPNKAYRYRVDYKNLSLLMYLVFNERNQVVVCDTEDIRAANP